MALNKTTSLATLGQYQEDAIVSSTLIKKKAGTVTLFAFAKDQALSEHTAPFDALVQIIEGQMEISIGADAHQVSGGEIIILPANIPHALRAAADTKMLLTMIKSESD